MVLCTIDVSQEIYRVVIGVPKDMFVLACLVNVENGSLISQFILPALQTFMIRSHVFRQRKGVSSFKTTVWIVNLSDIMQLCVLVTG